MDRFQGQPFNHSRQYNYMHSKQTGAFQQTHHVWHNIIICHIQYNTRCKKHSMVFRAVCLLLGRCSVSHCHESADPLPRTMYDPVPMPCATLETYTANIEKMWWKGRIGKGETAQNTLQKNSKKTKTIKQYRTSKGKSMNIPITWTSWALYFQGLCPVVQPLHLSLSKRSGKHSGERHRKIGNLGVWKQHRKCETKA